MCTSALAHCPCSSYNKSKYHVVCDDVTGLLFLINMSEQRFAMEQLSEMRDELKHDAAKQKALELKTAQQWTVQNKKVRQRLFKKP